MSQKLILNIKGMHCRSCEIMLEEKISAIPNVRNVHVYYKRGTAEVRYEHAQPSFQQIGEVVRAAGYSLGKEDKKSWISKDPEVYMELFLMGAALAGIYLWLKIFGILDGGVPFAASPKLPVVFLIGLTAGISTCMALIGGLVLGISARHAEVHPEATKKEKFRPHLFFNVGRLVSFAMLGGVIGVIGSTFTISSSLLGILLIVVGAVMATLGFKLTGIFPRLEHGGITLPKSVSRFFGLTTEVKEYSHRGAFISGALTFFLPCGFTQAMQLYAVSTGSFAQGALIMSVFALGTMPGLLGIGGITSLVRGSGARLFFRFAGLTVIALGVVNMQSGYRLTGWTFASFAAREDSSGVTAEMQNGIQVIHMNQVSNGYRPNKLIVKKDVPVRWMVNATNPYTCTAYLVVPALGIQKALAAGENTIEFTPTNIGTLRFSCSMGMYGGTLTVVE